MVEMEMYLENMKSLRSQMHVIEEDAAMRSIEEQKQKTLVETVEKELQLVRSDTKRLKEEVEEMVKTSAHINSKITEKQRILSSMQKESSTLSQTLELLQQEMVILSVKIKEKRSYYSNITEELNMKLKEQQDWFNSHKQKMIEGCQPVEEYPRKPMDNHIDGNPSIMLSKIASLENMGLEMGGRYKDLMTQLESAKNKLEEVEARRSAISIASSKLKELVEQLKHQIKSVPSPLKEMDDNALEEEYKALMADKAREMEYMHSLEDQINQLETEAIQYSAAYASMGVDNSLRLESFCENFKIEVIRLTKDEIEFDMIGIDASLANAFRRILIAEVPTMAIETVLMVNNTSVMTDEVLAHRLGLIPLNADPRLFEYRSENDSPNEHNTIVYKLDVSCKKGGPRMTVKSDQLKWLPNGSELEMAPPNQSAKPKSCTSFSCSQDSMPEFSKKPPGVKHEDIVIDKLGPGQAIELEAHAVKGIGKVHAKWSPVSTAWYRMLPEVVLLKDIKGDDAEKLVKRCPVNVFDIEDLGNGEKKAVVSKPRACTLCRECIRGMNEELVELRRVKDHFIFTIESAAALPPEVVFTEAVKILEDKCDRVISDLS